MKVLHVLERSAPELVGYTVRAGYITKHQRRLGAEPVIVTSPFFSGATGRTTEERDGVRYYRSNHIPRVDQTRGRLVAYWTRTQMVRRYREYVAEVAYRERPDVIHAHSSYMNGIAARHASKRLGVPFVYELRGLWADTAVVEDGLSPKSLKYRMFWHLELSVVRRADMLVAISQGIRDALVTRGVDPEKILIVPNGVDTEVFAPRPADTELAHSLGLSGCFVVGFIGSVRRLEGIDVAIEAFQHVHRCNARARLVVVGDGPDRARLEAIVRAAGLDDVVRFTGQVPHDRVLQYYSIMDALIYPRIDADINQRVTPLKPLEAMAMGKVCLASDVGGLRELVEDGVTALLFKAGDSRDAAEKILCVAHDGAMRDSLSAAAIAAMRRDREWSVIASRYQEIYRRAAASMLRHHPRHQFSTYGADA